MAKNTDLAASLAATAKSTRAKVTSATTEAEVYQQPGRQETRPITVHFPKEVRDQLKIMAVELDTTMSNLIGTAFNDLFAKHGKPEIVPTQESAQI